MDERFDLDHTPLGTGPRFKRIAEQLSALSPIDSSETFNRYCREACRLWAEQFPDGIGKTDRFPQLLDQIHEGGAEIIRTNWGGVVITLHEHPRVEKYLVVRKGGYLALEKHAEKDEKLEVREGAGMILWRPANEHSLRVEALQRKHTFHFRPGIEHCLIGTEDLLVFERSTDPKGMDQDLIFVYEPETVAATR